MQRTVRRRGRRVKWPGIDTFRVAVIRHYKTFAAFAVTATVFVFAVIVLQRLLAQLHWSSVVDGVHAVPLHSVVFSVGCTLCSYTLLTFYDYLALRGIGHPLPWRRVAPVAFMAYGISHSVGLSTMSGGSIRYRNYSALGLRTLQVAGVVALATATFMLGAGTLFGVSLLAMSPHAARVLHLSQMQVNGLGVVILLLVASYVGLGIVRHRPIKLFGRNIQLPPGRIVLPQLLLGSLDLCMACGALYALLPNSVPIGFPAFLGIYVLALQAGVISNVPGGIGVFEAVLTLLLPGSPSAAVLGAVLLYRFIYYLVPFVIALCLLATRELLAGKAFIRRISGLVQRWAELIGPQVLSVAVFGAGAVLLFSGATPEVDARIDWLRRFVPLPVLEFSHVAGSAVGVALLILARGLYRRLDAAWWVTMLLLLAGIAASLLKGFDYEEAILLDVLVLVLGLSRARFYRRASLLEQSFSWWWLLSVTVVVGSALWLSMMSYQDVRYERDLWWEFAFDSDAPRVMRAVLASVIVAAGWALWTLLSPARPDPAPATPADIEKAADIVSRSPDTFANLVLLGDKQLLFDDAGDAFIMFQRSGGSLIAMGDPVGNRQRFARLAWRFRELCDRSARWPVFYQASAEMLPLYLDLGLALAKLGEEARVNLSDFSLEGPRRGDLRNEHRRALRDGASFTVLTPDEVGRNFERLQLISDQWLLARATAEKGFSVGRFAHDYVQRFPHACVIRNNQIVAFATIWRTRSKEELSIDLMRYGDGAPRGAMDYLFIELMLWGRREGYRWFNLGMAPLSGLERHPMAPFWHKLGIMVQRYGGTFYNFEGLRKYKEKFAPVWRPRYLASPGGLVLPRVALDAAALIAGGVREVISK